MNIFEAIHNNHTETGQFDTKAVSTWLSAIGVSPNYHPKMVDGSLKLDNYQVVMILAYFGPYLGCLSDREYAQFLGLLETAKAKLMVNQSVQNKNLMHCVTVSTLSLTI